MPGHSVGHAAEIWRQGVRDMIDLTSILSCEEYKQLQAAFDAARGEWIHFRLTASKRAAGITEGQTKEMIARAKDKMEKAKNDMLFHLQECAICRKISDALRGAAS
jgi:hypothetical protein